MCPLKLNYWHMEPADFEHSRLIRLTGSITEESSEKFLDDLREESLNGIDGGITVVIHSDGGDIEDGFRILDAMAMLKSKGFKFHTIVTGKAYSMAAYMFCLGDLRTAYTNARLMFHASRYEELEENDVTRDVLMKMCDELKVYDDKFRDIMWGAGLPMDLIEQSMHTDVYLGVSEAMKYGLVQSVEQDII